MIGELYRVSEFDKYNLFDRFLDQSRASHVPMEFAGAYSNVVNEMAARLYSLDQAIAQYQEAASRLFQEPFSTEQQAQYAIQYSLTTSSFKMYDQLHAALEPLRSKYSESEKEYQAKLSTLATRFGCSTAEVPEKAKDLVIPSSHLAYLKSNRDADLQQLSRYTPSETIAKEAAELSARTILGTESNLVKPNDSQIARIFRTELGGSRKVKPTMSMNDLENIRGSVEDYFSSEINRGRILLLAKQR